MAIKQKIDKKENPNAPFVKPAVTDERSALVCLMTDDESPEIIKMIEGIETLGVRLVIAAKHPVCLHMAATTQCGVSQKEALDSADIAIVFNKEDIAAARKNGCVPVAPELDGSTVNYNPVQEKGNGFYFKNTTSWDIFAALVRALETYQFPYDWQNVVKAAK